MRYKNLVRTAISAALASPNRHHKMGASAIRGDGAVVSACNGRTFGTLIPKVHAEIKLINKLDSGAIVCVVRVLASGKLGIAKPCPNCMRALQNRHVIRVLFSGYDGSIDWY